MRSGNVLRSFKYGFCFSIIVMILTFFVRRYFIESFGKELTGYYLLINQLLGYLNLAELGLTTASVYLFFKPLNSENKQEIKVLFFTIKKIYSHISLAIFILGFLVLILLPYMVKDKIDWISLYIPWIIFVISTAISYLYSAESVLLTADEKLYVVKVVNGLARSGAFIVQILILRNGGDFLSFCFIEILYAISQFYVFKRIIYKIYGKEFYIHQEVFDVNKEIRKKVFKEVKKTFVHKVSGVLIFNTDYIIISLYIGLAAIAVYSSYLMLIQAAAVILGTIVSPLGAAIGNYKQRTNAEQAYSKFKIINTTFFLCATVACIMYNNISTPIVQLWMGNEVFFSSDIVLLLAINCFCLIARSAVDVYKVGYGYMSDIHLPILEGASNLIISVILVKFIGVKGVIIGTITSNIIIIMIARPWYLYRNAFKLSSAVFFKDHLKVWFASLLVLFSLYQKYDKKLLSLISESLNNYFKINSTIINFLSSQIVFCVIITMFTTCMFILLNWELWPAIRMYFRRKMHRA